MIKLTEAYKDGPEIKRRDILVKKENILMVVDDDSLKSGMVTSARVNTPMARVTLDLSGQVREVYVLGTAKLIKERLNMPHTSPTKGIIYG